MLAPAKTSRAHHPDYVLAISVFVLLAVGLIMMYSVSPVLSHKLLGSVSRNYYFVGQLGSIAVGMLAWVLFSQVHYSYWKKWAKPMLTLAAIMLVALLVPALSFSKNGATRWLQLGPVTFQPAEFLKLALVLYLAKWFEQRGEAIRSFWDGLMPFTILLAISSFVVVVMQRDMGTMLVVAAAAVSMYFVAGARLSHFGGLLAAGLAASWLAIIAFPHRLARLTTFLDPGKDASGAGYHINQALIAIGSGGFLGLGLGKSIQLYGYLPEAANDSIFAIIAEEFGFVGSFMVLGLFALLAYRGFKVAELAPDQFARLTAVGISAWMLSQAVINVAAMLSLVPLTGIPLPFISYGGSSLLLSLAAAGILLNISKYTLREVENADPRQRRRDGWSYIARPRHTRRPASAR